MGLVYDVEHLELGKRFVLKALLSDLASRDDIVARLRNEQRALGRLQHPNIVAVTDAGVTSTHIPYFVMERAEGETLAARLKKSRRLPVVEAIAIARGVLEGLSAAHEIGVVHRDIKPQNILVAQGNRPKILDFGVAKISDSASVITKRGIAIGTPRYMSPEQVRGERIDGRSDLYAVGLLLFESIAGKGPFDDARDANDMLVAHLEKVPPRLGAMAQGVTRELDALVASLLAKAPHERPPTARAAAAALGAVLDRYGGGNLDAPTPHTSYSTITRAILQPSGNPSGLVTRPDGVAARDVVTVANPPTSSGGTLFISRPGEDATNADAPRAPGGTLYDPSSRAITVAHQHAVLPPDAVRTERLEPHGLPLLADEPTRTRVPSTPSDGTPSLVPVRVEGPRSQRGRPLVFSVAAGVLLVLLAGGYWFVRGSKETANDSPGEAAQPAAERKVPELRHAPAAESPSVTAGSTTPTAGSPAAKDSGPPSPTAGERAASATPVKRERPPVREHSATHDSHEASNSPRPPPSGPKTKSAPSAPIPAGLPGSGL